MKKAIAFMMVIAAVVAAFVIFRELSQGSDPVRFTTRSTFFEDEEDDDAQIELPDTSDPSGLQRGDDGILIGSAVFREPLLLMGAYDGINVRMAADTDSLHEAVIGLGQVAEATEVVNGWYRVTVFPGMYTGYVRSDFLVEYDESKQFFAETRIDHIEVTRSNGETVVLESRLVDVMAELPELEYYIIFATPHNFTGRTLYARDLCLLQAGTVEKLRKAQEIFSQDGYTIKIYDTYRPSSVSGILYDIIGDPMYIAPRGTSIHNRAAAIDMTLVDASGRELAMPSPMHTFNRTSHRNSTEMSAEARSNMEYMTSVMRQCGFTTVQSEWWHFGDSESGKYPPLDFMFTEFAVYSVDRG